MTTLTTGVRLDEKEWDSSKVCVSFRKATPERAKELLAMQEHLEKMLVSLESIVAEKQKEQVEFTVETLVEEYKGLGLSKSFFSMMGTPCPAVGRGRSEKNRYQLPGNVAYVQGVPERAGYTLG